MVGLWKIITRKQNEKITCNKKTVKSGKSKGVSAKSLRLSSLPIDECSATLKLDVSSTGFLTKYCLKSVTCGLLALGSSVLLGTQAHAAETERAFETPQEIVPGRILIKLKNTDRLEFKEGQFPFRLSKERDSILDWKVYSIEHLNGDRFTEEETFAAIIKLSSHQDIGDISVDYWQRKMAVPNDRLYPQMWHLDEIGAEAAWDITKGTSSQRIGVIDTGVLRAHEDLRTKDLRGYDFISDVWTANDNDGRDANYNDPGDGANCGFSFTPSSFHGTHVSGTILAQTNNGKGIAGINWNAKLVTVRALGRCGGSSLDIMEGAAWMAGKHINGVPDLPADRQVSVMNLSLGGTGACSSFQNDIVNFIDSKNVLFVAAAGNSSSRSRIIGSSNPANCSRAISVAAHNASNERSSFSNFDSLIDIVAPGGDVVGDKRKILSSIGPTTSDYDEYPGTSMAAPHVVGAISLFQAIRPDLTLSQVRQLFRTYSDTCSGCQGKPKLRADLVLAALSGGNGNIGDANNDDNFSGNSSASRAAAIECNRSYNLKMLAGDHDWFKVVPVNQSQVNVSIDSIGSGYDLDLYLYRSNGTTLLGKGITATGDEAVAIDSSQGEIKIDVQSYNNAAGDYRLKVECIAPNSGDQDAAFEPNNLKYQSKELKCGDSYLLSVGANDDNDWFKLKVANRQTYTIAIDGGEIPDLDLYIYEGTSGTASQKSVGYNAVESITTRANNSAQYARIFPYGGSNTTIEYSISLSCETPASANSLSTEFIDFSDENESQSDSSTDLSFESGCSSNTSTPLKSLWIFMSLIFITRRKKK